MPPTSWSLRPALRPLAAIVLLGGGVTAAVTMPPAPAVRAASLMAAGARPGPAAPAAARPQPAGRSVAAPAAAHPHGREHAHATSTHRHEHARASRSHPRVRRWVRPARGPVTSWFGRRWGTLHPGIDIGATYGSKIRAMVGGHVISAGWIPGYGKIVRVRHSGRVFYYPHMSRIRIHHGHVHQGEVLGRVGSTGYSTGPHLHVEIRVHGRPVNPGPILRRHGIHLPRRHR